LRGLLWKGVSSSDGASEGGIVSGGVRRNTAVRESNNACGAMALVRWGPLPVRKVLEVFHRF